MSDRPKQDFREVILDGDCRTNRRYLEIRASSDAERGTNAMEIRRAHLSKFIDHHKALCPGDRAYAEPKNLQIVIAYSWSWAIGSSTSAARRSFDVVVSRRQARPFASIAELGLQENGRPSPRGTVVAPAMCWHPRERTQ